MALDKQQARELGLYIENDGNLYRSVTIWLINNFARKKLKGNYNKILALKGILILVEAGRKKYIKDFGSIGGTVSGDTKMEVAKYLYPAINEEATFNAKRLKKAIIAKQKLKKIVKRKR